jgi:hypothetical protein
MWKVWKLWIKFCGREQHGETEAFFGKGRKEFSTKKTKISTGRSAG